MEPTELFSHFEDLASNSVWCFYFVKKKLLLTHVCCRSVSSILAAASTAGAGTGTTTGTTTTTTLATSVRTTTATTTTTAVTATATPTAAAAAHWAQCGGVGWTGATTCVSPYTCTVQNSYYSQCL